MIANRIREGLEGLEDLAEDESEEVRAAVAMNQNTPTEVLVKLAEDESEEVRAAVALHPNVPLEIIRKLSKDESEQVKEAVANCTRTPSDILEELIKESRYIMVQVAFNKNTPANVLRTLFKLIKTLEVLCGEEEERVKLLIAKQFIDDITTIPY
ncbi:MAG: HEAT repeat domain-containing protein [Candidatus Korarchaeum sp.]